MLAPPVPFVPLTKIVCGDALQTLRQMRDGSVHCVVTSPPYLGLRDYGQPGQIGLEPSPQEYVAKLVEIFREVRRVLRADGTCWLNLGDSYAGSGKGGNPENSPHKKQRTNVGSLSVVGNPSKGKRISRGSGRWGGGNIPTPDGLKRKDLIGIPWRVAFALQQDGWYLRQDIIWHKPNPMPESVRDRCTKAHEYLFMLTKSAKYFYDAAATKEPVAKSQVGRKRKDDPIGGKSWVERGQHRRGGGYSTGRASGNKTHKAVTEYESSDSEEHRTKAGLLKIAGTAYETRNKRSVWTIPPKPYKEAHFATFPPALVEPCIKAGCPEHGIVMDIFAGAGTTGLVAKNLNRHAVLIELNPEYVKLIEKRLS